MQKLIRHTLEWVRALFVPRVPGRHTSAYLSCSPADTQRVSLRLPERPFPMENVLFDGNAVPIVRPYLVAHEERLARQQQQWERKRSLRLAVDGVDIGPWTAHGMRAAAGMAL